MHLGTKLQQELQQISALVAWPPPLGGSARLARPLLEALLGWIHIGKSPRARDLLRPGRSKERLSGHLLEASRASELKCCKKFRQATPEQLRPSPKAILSTIFTNIVTHASVQDPLHQQERHCFWEPPDDRQAHERPP